jgi:hypothetical protein
MKTNPAVNHLSSQNHTSRILALGLLAGLLLCTLARGQDTNPPALSPAGVYALVSVDGKTVPGTINHEGTAMDISSGSFTITTNGQCFCRMIVSVGDRKNITCDTRATYTLKGAELTMQWQGAGQTTGVIAGRTFTMGNEGMAFVYRK